MKSSLGVTAAGRAVATSWRSCSGWPRSCARPIRRRPAEDDDTDSGQLVLEVHKGQLIRLERPAAAVFVADPEVADVQAHSPTLV